MPKYLNLDKFREMYGFGEICDECRRDARVCADVEKYSWMDLCSLFDDAEEEGLVEDVEIEEFYRLMEAITNDNKRI